jgi:hypothetical protein
MDKQSASDVYMLVSYPLGVLLPSCNLIGGLYFYFVAPAISIASGASLDDGYDPYGKYGA